MIDLRAWRLALLSVPLAVTVAMFSLQQVPSPRQGPIAPDAYDGEAAASLARDLAESAPDPRPGSHADQLLAGLVQARFGAIAGSELSEQRFTAEYQGHDVDLRNLIVVLPGSSDREVALIANRDAAAGTGAASTIASTAALLEIASSYSGTTHTKTLVFVSTDGDSLGNAGVRHFIGGYSDRSKLDAAVVLSQPAVKDPFPPLVVPWSTGPQSTGIELVETAARAVLRETDRQVGNESPLADLFRLALPSGLGGQGPLIESGIDSIRISAAGDRPLDPGADVPANVSTDSIERFGRATLALILALDAAPGPLEHGPDAYIRVAGNLLPGWALALIALSLLLPVAIAVADGIGRSARSPLEAARGLRWAAARSLPFLCALLATYFLASVGLIPSPAFPFDPQGQSLGAGGAIGVLLSLAALAAGCRWLRPLRPPTSEAAAAAAPATVALAALAVFAIWVINPYLALLLALGLNLWLLAALPSIAGRLAAAALVLLGLVPLIVCVGALGDRLGTGTGVLWDLLYMVTGGQIGFGLALFGCVLAGCATAIVALGGPVPAPTGPEIRVRARGDRDEGGSAAGEPAGYEDVAAEELDPQEASEPTPDRSVYW